MSERITFDLGGTIIGNLTGQFRPGAEQLLEDLRDQGFELVLWTSTDRHLAERVFRKIPWLEDYFARVITATEVQHIELPSSWTPAQRQLVETKRSDPALGRYAKFPPAVDSYFLVDDHVGMLKELSASLGFALVDASDHPEDPVPDAWATRVAAAIFGSSE